MKTLSLTLMLLGTVAISFSQTFYIHTANSSGLWTDAANWSITIRTDGVSKNKVIIPRNFIIIVDNGVNSLGLNDVEIVVYGNLSVMPGTNLNLSANSNIQVMGGSIIGSDANQKIKIGSDIKYKGNTDATSTGYFMTDKSTGSSPGGFITMSILPVNFTSFCISKSVETIQLTWSTANEKNSSHFDVERSSNGTDWERIARVPGAGNSNNANNYSYNDKIIKTPVIYYRLRQVDTDGRASYSSIKTLRAGEAVPTVRIYGANSQVVIELNASFKKALVVSIVNLNGQIVDKYTTTSLAYRVRLPLSNVVKGIYIVRVSDNEGWAEARKVLL